MGKIVLIGAMIAAGVVAVLWFLRRQAQGAATAATLPALPMSGAVAPMQTAQVRTRAPVATANPAVALPPVGGGGAAGGGSSWAATLGGFGGAGGQAERTPVVSIPSTTAPLVTIATTKPAATAPAVAPAPPRIPAASVSPVVNSMFTAMPTMIAPSIANATPPPMFAAQPRQTVTPVGTTGAKSPLAGPLTLLTATPAPKPAAAPATFGGALSGAKPAPLASSWGGVMKAIA